MTRVGVTGGGGFIGRNLVQGLRDVEIDAPARGAVDMEDAVAVRRWLERGRFDVVIHAATHNATAVANPAPGHVLRRNLAMFNALAGCPGAYGKLAWFGSGAEFDRRHWRADMAEDQVGEHVPADEYGLSKLRMTEASASREDIVNLRVFGCYGPYEDWRVRFVSQAIVRAMWGLPIRLRKHNSFDYLWVGDLVQVVQWFLHNAGEHRVYNVCTGHQVELYALAQVVDRAFGGVGIEVAEPGRGVPYGGVNTRLLDTIPGLTFTTPEEGIRRLAEHLVGQKANIPREAVEPLG